MACLLILVFSGSFIIRLNENMSEKFAYLVETLVKALSCFKTATYMGLLPINCIVWKR